VKGSSGLSIFCCWAQIFKMSANSTGYCESGWFDYHADGSVSVHQYQYIQKVLSYFGMENCQPRSTPMNPKHILNHSLDEEPPDDEAKAHFATTIGSLMYLMVGTRPDIAFALGKCVESLHVPAAIASLHQSHSISSYYLPQWAINQIHGSGL
jgi:hypothetical protein